MLSAPHKTTTPVLGAAIDWVDFSALEALQPLFEYLPTTPFFTKDANLVFTNANTAMADLCGVRRRETLIGKRAGDFLSSADCVAYEALERRVMDAAQPARDQIFSTIRGDGNVSWLLLACWPIFAPNRRTVGVASVARMLEPGDRRRHGYERVAKAIALCSRNRNARMRVCDLARRLDVSVSQLERDFIELFDVPPSKYFARARLATAMDMLKGGETIADIAHACGYADQSAFTRRFQAAHGMTPSEFRRAQMRAALSK